MYETLIERELNLIVSRLGREANVPKDTGNLWKSIKFRKVSPNKFQVYIDDKQAPYAAELEPFWNRVFVVLSHRLAAILNTQGQMERGE